MAIAVMVEMGMASLALPEDPHLYISSADGQWGDRMTAGPGRIGGGRDVRPKQAFGRRA